MAVDNPHVAKRHATTAKDNAQPKQCFYFLLPPLLRPCFLAVLPTECEKSISESFPFLHIFFLRFRTKSFILDTECGRQPKAKADTEWKTTHSHTQCTRTHQNEMILDWIEYTHTVAFVRRSSAPSLREPWNRSMSLITFNFLSVFLFFSLSEMNFRFGWFGKDALQNEKKKKEKQQHTSIRRKKKNETRRSAKRPARWCVLAVAHNQMK